MTTQTITRTAINPWTWSLNFGYSQGEIIQNPNRVLNCSGQCAVDQQGNPMHIGDMRGQMTLALKNLEVLLSSAEMSFSNIIGLKIYSTDVDQSLNNFDVLAARLAAADVQPPMTLLGVNRLAISGLMFEIEASAAD